MSPEQRSLKSPALRPILSCIRVDMLLMDEFPMGYIWSFMVALWHLWSCPWPKSIITLYGPFSEFLYMNRFAVGLCIHLHHSHPCCDPMNVIIANRGLSQSLTRLQHFVPFAFEREYTLPPYKAMCNPFIRVMNVGFVHSFPFLLW